MNYQNKEMKIIEIEKKKINFQNIIENDNNITTNNIKVSIQ
jgi:hypothetical protein